MNLNGSKLVLETDGTYVDDDEVLKALATETFILLEPNQNWKSVDSLSTCSTLTLSSDGSMIYPDLGNASINLEI